MERSKIESIFLLLNAYSKWVVSVPQGAKGKGDGGGRLPCKGVAISKIVIIFAKI